MAEEEETEGEQFGGIGERKKLKFREYIIYDYHNLEEEEESIRKKEDDLYEACIRGDLKKVKECVAKGFDINAPDVEGESCLHYATKANHLEIVQYLISQKAHVNAKGLYLKAPIHYACENGNLRAVKAMMSAGVDIAALTRFRENALHFVCRNGSKSICKLLISQNKINLEDRDIFKRTPLHYCSENGFEDITKMVLLEMEKIHRKKDEDVFVPQGYIRRGPVKEREKNWEFNDIEQQNALEISHEQVKPLFQRVDIFEFNQIVNETGELAKIRQEVEMYKSMCQEVRKEIREIGKK